MYNFEMNDGLDCDISTRFNKNDWLLLGLSLLSIAVFASLTYPG